MTALSKQHPRTRGPKIYAEINELFFSLAKPCKRIFVDDMSLVGPRPNVLSETRLYTKEEQRLLDVKPGITDFASIVFADEGEILEGFDDPDEMYRVLIRPGKSQLGLFYVEKNTLLLDLLLILITVLSVFSRNTALFAISKLLKFYGANNELVKLSSRKFPLQEGILPKKFQN